MENSANRLTQNKIEKRELKADLKYKGTVVLTYKIEYPEMTESNYNFGKKIFNEFNKQKSLDLENYAKGDLFREAKELYDYNTANGYPAMVYEVDLQYEVTYNKDNIVSLYFDQYEFSGGAHGSTIRTSQNWNLIMGSQLPLSYFYPNTPNYVLDILKSINMQIREQIEVGNNYYFENYCELVIETFNLESYYITSKGIVVYFQQYDIAPYSSGIPVFYF